MKKTMMVLALCLMSAMIFAGNRQVSTTLPAETPYVVLTLDGKQRIVQPTQAAMREVDDNHVECIVYAGKDKAKVTLPISFDNVLSIGYHALDIAHDLHIISDEQWQMVVNECQRLGGCK